MGTALMIVFGVGVHCSSVLKGTKYRGSGHIFAITTWGFGISIALFIFGNVCINPAMVLAQCLLGNLPWTSFIPYSEPTRFCDSVNQGECPLGPQFDGNV